MHFVSIVVIGWLAASAAAVPFSSTHVVHERREAVPKAWTKRGRVEGTFDLPIRVGMTQSNLHKGHDLLLEV